MIALIGLEKEITYTHHGETITLGGRKRIHHKFMKRVENLFDKRLGYQLLPTDKRVSLVTYDLNFRFSDTCRRPCDD